MSLSLIPIPCTAARLLGLPDWFVATIARHQPALQRLALRERAFQLVMTDRLGARLHAGPTRRVHA